jgi:hypothetical protein
MSTQGTRLLSSIPQADLFPLRNSYVGKIKYLANRLSGCWHLHLSRPITRGRHTHRACLRCGMQRRFDLENWKSTGPFYAPTVERRSY